MSGSIQSTPEVIKDLDDIWDYIAHDSALAADRLLDQLHHRFELLAVNPEMGELQPLLADGKYRRFCFRKYVIYYRPLQNGIVLVRVLHDSRDHEKLL
jgi:toxin ParE1/3/4